MVKRSRKNPGRGLTSIEVALAKRMIKNGYPRDHIVSFFVRPGRIISPAFVREIADGDLGGEIEPATELEVERFMARRMQESSQTLDQEIGGAVSPTRVREAIAIIRETGRSFAGFEDFVLEFKQVFDLDRVSKAKIAKTMASFSNAQGGYIVFGVKNDGSVCGIEKTPTQKEWDQISDTVAHFSPAINWEKNVLEFESREVAVIYTHSSLYKPVISTSDFTSEINEGDIYYRYNGSSSRIKAGDLISLLAERDRLTLAFAQPPRPLPLDGS